MVGLGDEAKPICGTSDLVDETQESDGSERETESEQGAVDGVFRGFVQVRHALYHWIRHEI